MFSLLVMEENFWDLTDASGCTNQGLPDNLHSRFQDYIEYIIVSVIPFLFICNMQFAFEWRATRRSFIGNYVNGRNFHLCRSWQDCA